MRKFQGAVDAQIHVLNLHNIFLFLLLYNNTCSHKRTVDLPLISETHSLNIKKQNKKITKKLLNTPAQTHSSNHSSVLHGSLHRYLILLWFTM